MIFDLADGSGDHAWKFKDWNANIIYAIWLRVDEEEWQSQYEELTAG